MKTYRLITLFLTLTYMILPAAAKDDQGHTLVRLWSEYYKAVDADKPKDQADILLRIKQEASQKHLAWDFYDATWKYVQARTSTNWKLREELNKEAEGDLERFGEPVAVFYHRRSRTDTGALLSYIRTHKSRMEAAHNPEFYERDGDLSRHKYAPALLPRIANDYEYALWSLLGRRDADASRELAERFNGRYPLDAFVEFSDIARGRSGEESRPLYEAYAQKYAGKAVALLARESLLLQRHNDLRHPEGTSAQYRALADDCERFVADRKRFSGEEKAIAQCCTSVDDILGELNGQEITARVERGVATLTVRNLPQVRVRLLKGKEQVYDRMVANTRRSFYVPDTLTFEMPALDDGTYTLKCTEGKAEAESEYDKYSLSIAHKRDLGGYGVYVADYITGEPVQRCDILLLDREGRQVDAVKDLAIDGFTYLPERFAAPLEKDRWGYALQAVASRDGRVLKSQRHGFRFEARETVGTDNPARHHAMILTDRGAYNPDETVQFKVLLYEGTYAFATRPAGVRLHATLTDPTDKEIAQADLTTGEFGTAAGSFVLRKGERGGMYTINVSEDGKQIASASVRADEFVLPTFDLSWQSDDRFYLPGDQVLVRGAVKSYSGHNLGTASARYTVESDGKTLSEGPLELGASGDFSIRFTAPDNNYYYNHAAVTVVVTDGTGETLEFHRAVTVTGRLPLGIEVLNESEGRFETASQEDGAIIGDDFLRARFQTGYGERLTHPTLKIAYKVLRGQTTLLSGEAPNGEPLNLSLAGLPSGLYTVEATATAVSDAGKSYTQTARREVVKAADTDTMLDLDAFCFFKEMADDGRSIALQVGTTTGPAWIVAELYGDGNRLLDKRLVRLAGVRGRAGSLETIRFARQDGYPETLTLKVFWFRDGRSFEYTVSSYRAAEAFRLPLAFSRFLDTTAPHADYTFTLQTAAGTEVAATVFDKSTETIQRNAWYTATPSRRRLPDVEYSATPGTDSAYGYTFGTAARRGDRILMKSAAVAFNAAAPEMAEESLSDALSYVDEVVEEVAITDAGAEPENPAIRENFANTIAWEPFLRADQDGVVTFHFTTADKLSTYYVQLFAHDKAFHNATLRREMVVTLPVKVAVVQPQFLYEGDRYVARVTLANSKDVPVSGRLAVRFLGGTDYKTAPLVQEKTGRVTVPAGGSADVSFEIAAPALRDLGLLVNFTADSADFGSDGVFVTMPVRPAVQTLTEAHSALLLAGMDREAVLAGLRSQFVNVPGADAALREISILDMIREAVPQKVVPASDNLLDQSEALFANHLLDILPGTPVAGASPEEREAMVDKILACRGSDGGYAWFTGMTSSPILTAVLLERLAAMGGACPQALAANAPAAVRYLDQEYFGARKRPYWCGGLSLDQYLHVRALYPEVPFEPKDADAKQLREFRKAAKAYLVPSAKRGLNGQVFAKARRMKTLRALVTSESGSSLAKSWGISLFTAGRLRRSLDKDIASLLQYAEPHRSGGTYYPNAVMPWRGLLESELYAHALICDLLSDCGHDEVAEGIRLWIMVQKETQQWEDDPAYIQAIGSVLRGTEATLQTRVLALNATKTLPFADIKAAGNGFTVSRSFTREGKPLRDGDILHVGDKVTATYSIWNEENRSFVRLTAPRPAAFRPVDQLSGRYGWFARPISITGWVSFSPQGYRSVLADRTEFWFDSYPEEKTSFTEEFFVTQEGTFQCPVPVIESLYAPHYRANDDGKIPFVVRPQQ